jgi:hypothetical protein
MYRPTANQIGFACNGFAAGPTITQTQTFMGQDLNFNLGGDHIVMSGANSQIRGSTTLVGAPPFAFFADTDTGLWNPGADQLSLVTAGISRWEVNASGHLISGGGLDNTYDIGVSGATRPRRIYVGTSIVVPSITLDGDLLWATDGSGNIGSGPTSLDNRPANIWVRYQLQVGDNTVTLTSGGDITAGDGANEMFWSASGGSLLVTSPATFGIDVQGPNAAGGTGIRIQNTSSNAAAFPVLNLHSDTALAQIFVRSSNGPTANEVVYTSASGPMTVGPGDAQDLRFRTTGMNRWVMSAAGHLIGATDNAFDIGVSGATRPRTAYLGTSLNVGNVTASIAEGDIVAGTSANEARWDATAGRLSLRRVPSVASPSAVDAIYANNDGFVVIRLDAAADDVSTKGIFLGRKARGTVAAPTAVGTADHLAEFSAQGYDGSQYNSAAAIIMATDGAPTSGTTTPGLISFWTAASPDAFALPKWQIRSNGDFQATTDNSWDIGDPTDLRPRTGYFGTALNIGTALAVNTGDVAASLGVTNNYLFYDASIQRLHLYQEDASTTGFGATGGNFLIRRSVSGGVGAAGIGVVALEAQVEGSVQIRTCVRIEGVLESVGASADGAIIFNTTRNGVDGVDVLRLRGSDRTARIEGGLEVGLATGTVTGNGDIVAGDGTHEISWDASAGSFVISGVSALAGAGNVRLEGSFDGPLRSRIDNPNAGNSALSQFQAVSDGASATMTATSSTNTGSLGINTAAFHASSGADRMVLCISTAAPLELWTTDTKRWEVSATGHLLAATDNDYDIGASGATRPRTAYVGTSVVIGDTITITTDSIDSNGAMAIGGATATSLAIGRSGITTDFVSGSTVDFTDVVVTGLSLGTPRQEELTTENIVSADVTLADTLDFTPVNESPTSGFYASVVLFLNGILRRQGVGLDYTVDVGTSGIEITWLANSGTAVDMDTSDVLTVVYSSSD